MGFEDGILVFTYHDDVYITMEFSGYNNSTLTGNMQYTQQWVLCWFCNKSHP